MTPQIQTAWGLFLAILGLLIAACYAPFFAMTGIMLYTGITNVIGHIVVYVILIYVGALLFLRGYTHATISSWMRQTGRKYE